MMKIRLCFTYFILSLFLNTCSSNSASDNENSASQATIEEIETLDSLNQALEKSTREIEENIQAVEAAVSELDDFE